MYRSAFLEMFSCGEVKEIHISIKGEIRNLHIRRLSFHECSRFRRKCKAVVSRATLGSMMALGNNPAAMFSIPDEEVELGEYYLLKRSICDPQGTLIFDEDEEGEEFFMGWLDSINDEICQEIIKEIAKFNKLSKKTEETKEDVKKKSD
jgi:hypothetical protein